MVDHPTEEDKTIYLRSSFKKKKKKLIKRTFHPKTSAVCASLPTVLAMALESHKDLAQCAAPFLAAFLLGWGKCRCWAFGGYFLLLTFFQSQTEEGLWGRSRPPLFLKNIYVNIYKYSISSKTARHVSSRKWKNKSYLIYIQLKETKNYR